MPSRLWNEGNVILRAGSTQKISNTVTSDRGALPYASVHIPLLRRPSASHEGMVRARAVKTGWGRTAGIRSCAFGAACVLWQAGRQARVAESQAPQHAAALGWARVAAAVGRATAWADLDGFVLGPQKGPPCLPHVWRIFTPILLKYKYKSKI